MKRAICLLFTLFIGSTAAAEVRTRYLVSPRFPGRAPGLGLMREINAENTNAKYQARRYSRVNVIGVDLTVEEAAQLRRSGDVRYVDPVVPRSILAEGRSLTAIPSARPQSVPYGIDAIRARSVWPAGRGGAGNVHVAVVDTGIDYDHPDLKDRYQGGFNALGTTSTDPMDDHGHGTHVAGTIAATDNAIGVVGVAPEARIWAVKVLASNGSGTDETVIAGVNWVIEKKGEIGGNWIANFSLGSDSGSNVEREVFAQAMREGIIVVAAAGNSSREFITIPASYPYALAISAIDALDTPATFTNFGRGISFAAPGVAVLSSVPVGTNVFAELLLDKEEIETVALVGSGLGEITGEAVDCGLGAPEDFPANVAGKIALIRRHPPLPDGAPVCSIPNSCFRDKVRNAVARGAAAAVIVPDERGMNVLFTLIAQEGDQNAPFPVVTVRTKQLADRLIAEAGKISFTIRNTSDDYGQLNGTSMATPHVVGALALAWSLAPNATAEQVTLAAKFTASDLGPQGYDKKFGYGRIDAFALARYLSPGLFGVEPPPPAPPRGRRIVGR